MINNAYIIDLYRRYLKDLRSVRDQQRRFLRWNNNTVLRRLYRMRLRSYLLKPMLDDLEAEITYLLVRDRAPSTVVEMSPNTGWSTTWILSALRDNGNNGQLWSYDLHDTCTKLVPQDLAAGRWHFVLGDATRTITTAPEFDYLFIDSDHSASFARWYSKELLPRVKPGVVVSVHDVFHQAHLSEEGEVVAEWLKNRNLSYWSVASALHATETSELLAERRKLDPDFATPIHRGEANPMMFFVMK
ncbi:MAG: class I SAM-dependent methyltransferase [Nitrospiraceae bacterium]